MKRDINSLRNLKFYKAVVAEIFHEYFVLQDSTFIVVFEMRNQSTKPKSGFSILILKLEIPAGLQKVHRGMHSLYIMYTERGTEPWTTHVHAVCPCDRKLDPFLKQLEKN